MQYVAIRHSKNCVNVYAIGNKNTKQDIINAIKDFGSGEVVYHKYGEPAFSFDIEHINQDTKFFEYAGEEFYWLNKSDIDELIEKQPILMGKVRDKFVIVQQASVKNKYLKDYLDDTYGLTDEQLNLPLDYSKGKVRITL